jgi:uncharacterized protein YbjT (DUF2867 family)
MIAVVGATGHTGKVVAETLLAAGEKVRVIGRTPDKLHTFTSKGAEAFAGNVLDPEAMTNAFAGTDAVYVLIPPDLKAPKARAYQRDATESLATALQRAGAKYAVALSSVGAQLATGAGPVSGLHDYEQRLAAVPGLNTLFLRAGFFMENLLSSVNIYRTMNLFGGLVKGDVPLPMIASRDIGPRAADALKSRDFTGHQTQELLGQRDVTMEEAATIFGAAIGKPGLGYMRAPAAMAKPSLMQGGMSADTADGLIEMSKAISERRMVPLEPRTQRNTTATTLENFTAHVLVPAFRGQAASA